MQNNLNYSARKISGVMSIAAVFFPTEFLFHIYSEIAPEMSEEGS